MSQIHGQIITPGQPNRWEAICATENSDGTFSLCVDTELVLDSGNINISNLKIASVDQTSNTLRYIKVLDDGTIIVETTPLDSYEIADTDDENEPSPNYYGFTTIDEDWYIMEEIVTAIGTPNSYRYFKGTGSYPAAFTGRAGHTYDYFHNIF